ncbi:hypothetical protein K492DRAFT_175187 [Lichtheimia hyalospora FSU 10163]|nr:hypothetical protein K492DRAFT_175187 [Lichtheimia hyalospora FSU 10163]
MEEANLLHPQPPLAPSVSIQDETLFQDLFATPLPIKEVDDLFAMRDTLSAGDILQQFETIAAQLTQWLSVAHMTVFTLEQKVKMEEAGGSDSSVMHVDTKPLESMMSQMQPLVSVFVEAGEQVLDDIDDDEPSLIQRKMSVKMTIAKIQSEWSGLQHFMASVINAVQSMAEEKNLALAMEYILIQLDDISTMIFQYHETKHTSSATPSRNNSLSTKSSSIATPSPSLSGETRIKDNNDGILVTIDEKVEPVFRQVEKVYSRMTSDHPPSDKTGVLSRKHGMVQEKWENLRSEIDDLKDELKEDRWLTVFRQVADQVDVMIDGLDKTTAQCYAMIQQVRDWQAHGGNSTATHEIQPKSVLRNVPRSHASTTSISSSSSSGSAGYNTSNNGNQPPVDQHKFRSVEKNFEAKYKYYTPSIDRMLAMLGNGISSRVGQDMATTRRHQSMIQRWNQLKAEMDELRSRDIPETERVLPGTGNRPISPAYSRLSDRSDRSMSSMRFRSPEPPSGMNHHDLADYMATGSGGSSGSRAKSPLSRSSRTASPMGGIASYYDESRRGRSATPNSGRNDMWRGYGSPSGRLQRNVSPMSFSSIMRPSTSDSSSVSSASIPQPFITTTDDSNTITSSRRRKTKTPAMDDRRKSRIPATEDTFAEHDDRASWMRPTKSSLLRKQKAEQLKRDTARSTTPNSSSSRYYTSSSATPPLPTIPARPMSSLERQGTSHHLSVQYPDRRPLSPVRRSGTPSLIPRPKTPSGPSRAASPSMLPRPRSSMQMTCPSPPAHSSPPSKSTKSLRKKQSMPALMHHRRAASPNPRLLNARTPSPPAVLRSDDEEDDYTGYEKDYLYDDEEDDFNSHGVAWKSRPTKENNVTYRPDPKDPLDMEVARIVNASPIAIKCQKGPNGSGRYYFGSELSPSVGGGRKLYTCKLMSYTGRRKSDKAAVRNKVLVRVGGGWQDLELFLLHYGILH